MRLQLVLTTLESNKWCSQQTQIRLQVQQWRNCYSLPHSTRHWPTTTRKRATENPFVSFLQKCTSEICASLRLLSLYGRLLVTVTEQAAGLTTSAVRMQYPLAARWMVPRTEKQRDFLFGFFPKVQQSASWSGVDTTDVRCELTVRRPERTRPSKTNWSPIRSTCNVVQLLNY